MKKVGGKGILEIIPSSLKETIPQGPQSKATSKTEHKQRGRWDREERKQNKTDNTEATDNNFNIAKFIKNEDLIHVISIFSKMLQISTPGG
jgi:hypothetical protein